MHKLIDVSANAQIYPPEYDLKLQTAQEEIDNMLNARPGLEKLCHKDPERKT